MSFKENPCSLVVSSESTIILLPPCSRQPLIHSVSMSLPILDILCKWNKICLYWLYSYNVYTDWSQSKLYSFPYNIVVYINFSSDFYKLLLHTSLFHLHTILSSFYKSDVSLLRYLPSILLFLYNVSNLNLNWFHSFKIILWRSVKFVSFSLKKCAFSLWKRLI